MKEKILETLCAIGFQMEEMEGFGYGFNYESINMLYMPNDDDSDFLNICIPGIYEFDESNPAPFYELADKINSTMKYVKAYKLGDRLWLFYERELFEGEDLEQVITRMILRLEAALVITRKAITTTDEEEGNAEQPTETDPTETDKNE